MKILFMEFNYAKGYENYPEHYQKFSQFHIFLKKLSEEFSKELYNSGKFLAVGIGKNDIIYNPDPQMPPHIEKKNKSGIKTPIPLVCP
ncbi:MAG TPA: hypothetical protein VFN30_02130 [Chitinophagaceae bacterium]|nr:hypothetical protein [Chitinophagaceae bacterium]